MTLPSIATALSSVKKFNMAETLVDGWLQASIIEESVAIPCKTNEEAMSKVNEILGTATSQSSAIPHLASTEGYSVDHSRSTLSVFEVPISVKNEILRTAAVRTVNTETQSVRVDLYSHEINYKKIKHLPNNDPELMAKVAQIVNLATTPLDSLTRPLRLNPGRPPIMPKNMIEAYIIYCEFKGINLEPPEGYIQFQQSVKKPGWFGKDSLHDSFAKAWKISHPEDVGIKEQKELESTPAHPRPRSR